MRIPRLREVNKFARDHTSDGTNLNPSLLMPICLRVLGHEGNNNYKTASRPPPQYFQKLGRTGAKQGPPTNSVVPLQNSQDTLTHSPERNGTLGPTWFSVGLLMSLKIYSPERGMLVRLLKLENLKLREVEPLAQGHMAGKCLSRD